MGAMREATTMELKSGLAGALVRDAMISDFVAVSPEATLNDVSRLILSGSQDDFPVVEKGGLVGLLTHDDILEAIRSRPPEEKVASVMRTDFAAVEEEDVLDKILDDLSSMSGLPLPVLCRGRLSGLLTAGNIDEYYHIQTARAARLLQPLPPRETPSSPRA